MFSRGRPFAGNPPSISSRRQGSRPAAASLKHCAVPVFRLLDSRSLNGARSAACAPPCRTARLFAQQTMRLQALGNADSQWCRSSQESFGKSRRLPVLLRGIRIAGVADGFVCHTHASCLLRRLLTPDRSRRTVRGVSARPSIPCVSAGSDRSQKPGSSKLSAPQNCLMITWRSLRETTCHAHCLQYSIGRKMPKAPLLEHACLRPCFLHGPNLTVCLRTHACARQMNPTPVPQ